MPKYDLPTIAVIRTLENDYCVAEALHFPEMLRFSNDGEKARKSLEANLEKVVEEADRASLYQRRPVGEYLIREYTVTVDPPPHSSLWRSPVTLNFSAVCWNHGENARIAYFPPLGIEVVATSSATRAALDQMIPQHIRAMLARHGALQSLGRLIWLQRTHEMKLVNGVSEITLLTPRQQAIRAAEKTEQEKSALAEAANDLTKQKLPIANEMEESLAQLAEALIGRRPQSVLLIGPSGAGKTALVYELVRRRAEFQLAQIPFWATDGSRLVAGMSGFGQWQERCQQLWREAAQSHAVLYLGNLIELMEVGKSVSNSQGIAGFLRPYIARGDVLAIAECTPEQLNFIERSEPRLIEAFYQLKLEELPAERGRNVLLNYALSQYPSSAEWTLQPPIELEGIERIDQLHRRYAAYSANPGRPVRFLKNLLQDRPDDKTLTSDDVTEAFSRETGLPLVLLDERKKLDLEAVRGWFKSRVMGQSEAVDLIVDLLATVKAQLTRPRKPIASLLFIGPTGVGKTEMAKSLAEFLFQDRRRLARFDMSEYADPHSVDRLIGGALSAGCAKGEGLLTATVREQPFTVLLLDEFEKAHPSFFDLLLQVLGEGRLTDGQGRLADFSNTVVIMTSNLGADSFQRSLKGFGQTTTSRQAAALHFTKAVRQTLRPEMFNRIDRIVPFAPLDQATILQIARRELERVKQRDGVHYRGVNLKISDGVAEHFAARGYDPRYGARPLKRTIERELLAPLAEELNRHPLQQELTANLWLENGGFKLNVQKPAASREEWLKAAAQESIAHTARQVVALRREAQILASCDFIHQVENEIYRLEKLEKRLKHKDWRAAEDLERLATLPRLKTSIQAVKNFAESIVQVERQALLAVYGKAQVDENVLKADIAAAQSLWKKLLLDAYALGVKDPDAITLAIYSEDLDRLFKMARDYYSIAVRQNAGQDAGQNAKIEAVQFTLIRSNRLRAREKEKPKEKEEVKDEEKDENSPFEREPIQTPEKFLSVPRYGVFGIAFGINALLAGLRFGAEEGLHSFTFDKKTARCLVQTSATPLKDYQPPEGLALRDSIGHQDKRRNYNFDQLIVDDVLLRRKIPWPQIQMSELMSELMEDNLMARAREMLD